MRDMASKAVGGRNQKPGLVREAVIDLYRRGHGTQEIAELLGSDIAAVGWVLRIAGAV
jgi:hypothetical protein